MFFHARTNSEDGNTNQATQKYYKVGSQQIPLKDPKRQKSNFKSPLVTWEQLLLLLPHDFV